MSARRERPSSDESPDTPLTVLIKGVSGFTVIMGRVGFAVTL